MAGRPKLRALLQRIKTTGGFKSILDRIAEGETMRNISKDYEVSESMLGWYMRRHKKLGPLLSEARMISAMSHAEKAMEIIEDVDLDPILGQQKLTKAKMLADHHKWLATKFDREFFGDAKDAAQVNVQLNVADLHLSALKQFPAPSTAYNLDHPRRVTFDLKQLKSGQPETEKHNG